MVNIEKIQEAIKPVLDKHSVLLIDLVVRGERKSKIIEIFIDNYSGITTDLCVEVSRDVLKLIDEENLVTGNYQLNISSPGLSRPLKYPVQYHKHIGYQIEISFMNGSEIQKVVGELVAVDNESVTIKYNNQDFNIKFDDILKAIIKTPW